MSVTVAIFEGPLSGRPALAVEGAGAVICFEGIVRPMENGEPIEGLAYETYDPMARDMLGRLAGEVLGIFALLAVEVAHSRGWVPAGACSFRIQVVSRHRQEGLAAISEYIDAMKKDVPIWKQAVFSCTPKEPEP